MITKVYEEYQGTPISETTLLRVGARDVLADLDDTLIDDAFAFSELVALTGLADREFFQHTGYVNRDTFRLVAQRFTEPGEGVTRVTRRRDGTTKNYIPGDFDRVPCPEHVRSSQVSLDRKLLEALLVARDREGAEMMVDGIISFNLANTDAPHITPHIELVLVSGAFECVLGCKGVQP